MDSAAHLKAEHAGRPSLHPSSGTGTPLGSFGHSSPIPNQPGYTTPRFADKQEQQLQVEQVVAKEGFIPRELVKGEVDYFYNSVGIDDTYFRQENVDTIASHITSLYGSKILAYSERKDTLDIKLEKRDDDAALFIHTSEPGLEAREYEREIDRDYLNNATPAKSFRLETYRSSGHVSSKLAQRLRCYFVSQCAFVNAHPTAEQTRDIRAVSDKNFLERASDNTLAIYQEVMQHALERSGPVVEAFEVEGSREHRLVIGFKQGTTSNFFSALSKLYHWYGVFSSRKYVEQFSNGITLICAYLNPLRGPPIENSIVQIVREASLIYCLPNNPFFATDTNHAAQEAAYAYCGWIFCQHFLNRLGQSYLSLKNLLNEADPAHQTVLSEIRQRFRQETFTRQSIKEAITSYPELLRALYVQFAMVHYVSSDPSQLVPTLSYQRLNTQDVLSDEQLYNKIQKTISDKLHFRVFESLMIFNKAVLKTNFYQPTKVALSFRLSGNFLPPVEFPAKPFGIFLVVGSDFRGFHVRFKDVARGGIRLIQSRNAEAFSINQRNLFDENYSLASTQASKNKDIPEGGAKGTILPDLGAQPRTCFEKYIDSLLDLMLKGSSPGIKEDIVDLHKKPEILFLGPDEGTADMMDWAALHARERGATFWKSFTTGKSQSLGGIAHDTYGMTSLGVRQYIIGIYRQLSLKEEEITKVQTGGPDGDLGSNEILLSKDKTVAIIDGSGVIHDPLGLDRGELQRLARERKMVSHFDATKLSKEGYRVLVEDRDFKLPSGEIVPDGAGFRNKAHLRYKADLFVPCGGRPESINVSNVNSLFDAEGKPNFRFIVEGANLFITQQARLVLEQRGVILFKDASANKGGVTSSSLEVLSGLTLNDEEFIDLMTAEEGEGVSDFYAEYVHEIQRIICQNGTAEFNCLWKAAEQTGKPRAVLTDEVGRTLVDLQNELESSDLFENETARRAVLSRAIPKPLLDRLGLDTILQRLPEPYSRSLFASWIAAHYLYKYGLNASAVDFYHFFSNLGLKPKQ